MIEDSVLLQVEHMTQHHADGLISLYQAAKQSPDSRPAVFLLDLNDDHARNLLDAMTGNPRDSERLVRRVRKRDCTPTAFFALSHRDACHTLAALSPSTRDRLEAEPERPGFAPVVAIAGGSIFILWLEMVPVTQN